MKSPKTTELASSCASQVRVVSRPPRLIIVARADDECRDSQLAPLRRSGTVERQLVGDGLLRAIVDARFNGDVQCLGLAFGQRRRSRDPDNHVRRPFRNPVGQGARSHRLEKRELQAPVAVPPPARVDRDQ